MLASFIMRSLMAPRVCTLVLSSLQCIWMVCWKNCQSQVLVVIGVTCLLVLSAMLMIWFYWLLVHLLSGVCCPFVQSYADDHGLLFNATKTQLICFRSCKSYRFLPVITLNNAVLKGFN